MTMVMAMMTMAIVVTPVMMEVLKLLMPVYLRAGFFLMMLTLLWTPVLVLAPVVVGAGVMLLLVFDDHSDASETLQVQFVSRLQITKQASMEAHPNILCKDYATIPCSSSTVNSWLLAVQENHGHKEKDIDPERYATKMDS